MMTADERINDLLKRAGCPVMVVANEENHKTDLPENGTHVDDFAECVCRIMRQAIDTTDRLEAALENALNERDALRADFEEYVKRVIGRTGGIYACTLCKHYRNPFSEEFFRSRCPAGCEGYKNWEWRGVPNKGC